MEEIKKVLLLVLGCAVQVGLFGGLGRGGGCSMWPVDHYRSY